MALRDTETAEKVGDAGRQPTPPDDTKVWTLAQEAAANGWTRNTKPDPGEPAPAITAGTRN